MQWNRTLRFGPVLSLLTFASLFASVSASQADDTPKPLVFCAVPHSMPRMGKGADDSPEGLDIAIAKLVCKRLGRPFEMHWCGSPDCSLKCLAEKRCDVILGRPLDEGPTRELAWSVPYAGAQFGLVVTADNKEVRSLADLQGKKVGIVAGSVPIPENKHTVVRFQSREEVLDRFESDKLNGAFLDADFASWYLHVHPKLKLRLVADYVPKERWNVALAVRAKESALLVDLNRALSQLAEDDEIRKAYAGLGVVYRIPFTGTARKSQAIDTLKRIRERREIVFCMDPANLPYSSAKEGQPGFDVELARELAKELGFEPKIVWLDVHRETAIGKLLNGECDLAFGSAMEPNAVEDDDELAERVIYSRPYYGTGYLLIVRKEGPRVKKLEELKGEKSRRLGTEAGSIADFRLRQRGYLRSLYRNQLAVLKSLDDGGIDYAYVWANAGWLLHATPEFKLEIVPGYVPEDHWNIAIALRKGDDELKRLVDNALEKAIKDGAISRALEKYRMPHFPPFPEEKPKEEKQDSGKNSDGVIRHAVADRGLEPNLQKVQTSRNGQGGLERVRSAGTLVVGLDQNNLPFSTAHPEPAGLDYEIAQLLAEQLGVSMKVYWGYSSHDSYPSKLATKKLCDVMLNIVPDDRFGQRVLYSRPYHVAKYQMVVRAEGGPTGVEDLGDAALAVEQGLAIRGLEGKRTHPYSSLDAILEAVADGQEKAGYVISTRGQWLAEKRWSGKLKFVDLADSPDRFPICVALRKGDGDLKEAIDKALKELAHSGKLEKVFSKWHITWNAESIMKP